LLLAGPLTGDKPGPGPDDTRTDGFRNGLGATHGFVRIAKAARKQRPDVSLGGAGGPEFEARALANDLFLVRADVEQRHLGA
jgi:hypothetical protein